MKNLKRIIFLISVIAVIAKPQVQFFEPDSEITPCIYKSIDLPVTGSGLSLGNSKYFNGLRRGESNVKIFN